MIECFLKSNVSDGSCSDGCKESLEVWKNAQGCCVQFSIEFQELLSEDLFSSCGVNIPNACMMSFSPPEKFVDCAHDITDDKDGDVHVSPTVFSCIVMIMVSMFIAM